MAPQSSQEKGEQKDDDMRMDYMEVLASLVSNHRLM
jgi:hypothetical protein